LNNLRQSIRTWPQARARLIITVPVAIILMAGSFYAGDALSGIVQVPGLKYSHQPDFGSLSSLYTLLQRNYDGSVTANEALNGARAGLVAATGDPYTEYFTPAQAKALNNELTGTLSGIGAELGVKNNALTIIAPVAGTPAAAAGLQAGDVIADINNQDTSTMDIDTAVADIRGAAGTKVTLTIDRAGTPQAFKVTITRANITVPSVTWSMKNDDIGYINISQFGPDTAGLMDKAAGDLKGQGATKIILDLRNNPGGYLDAGVAVASEFLPQGKTIVSERPCIDSPCAQTSSGGGKLIGLPTIVLVNGGSASAAEIVSGALHDNGAAKLLGTQTFGKGSVQEIKDLSDGAELKVTVAHWYTPGGVNINKKGLTPDYIVQLSTADFNSGSDPQLDRALQLLQ